MLFPTSTLLVAGSNADSQPTAKFDIQKRDIAVRNLLVSRETCSDGSPGYSCWDQAHCCPNGWACCIGLLFFQHFDSIIGLISPRWFMLSAWVSTFWHLIF